MVSSSEAHGHTLHAAKGHAIDTQRGQQSLPKQDFSVKVRSCCKWIFLVLDLRLTCIRCRTTGACISLCSRSTAGIV